LKGILNVDKKSANEFQIAKEKRPVKKRLGNSGSQ